MTYTHIYLETLDERKKIWDEYQGVKTPEVRHNFVDYTRYYEAEHIDGILTTKGVEIEKLKVIDYGCCAGDYAIYFARKGAKSYGYDIDESALNFLDYRLKRENLPENSPLNKYDLVIFGEVLEHVDDPFNLIQSYIYQGAKYMFTSSYPYRNDDPQDSYWQGRGHSKMACEQQPQCRKLLETFYKKYNFGGQSNVWIYKM